MKSLLLAGIVVAIGIVFAATSWSDVSNGDNPSSELPPPPPTADTPSYVGSPIHEPFESYDPGPSQAQWQYDDLKPEEKALVDREGRADGWDTIHAGYKSAIQEQAVRAVASSAEHQLGLEGNSGEIGVVP